jgi:hypothetical protein
MTFNDAFLEMELFSENIFSNFFSKPKMDPLVAKPGDETTYLHRVK